MSSETSSYCLLSLITDEMNAPPSSPVSCLSIFHCSPLALVFCSAEQIYYHVMKDPQNPSCVYQQSAKTRWCILDKTWVNFKRIWWNWTQYFSIGFTIGRCFSSLASHRNKHQDTEKVVFTQERTTLLKQRYIFILVMFRFKSCNFFSFSVRP